MNLRSSLLRGFAPALTALAVATAGSMAANAASLIPTGSNGEIGYTVSPTGITNATGSVYTPVGGYAYNFIYSSLSAAVSGANGYYGNVAMDSNTLGLTLPANNTGGVLALDSDFNPYTGPVTISFATVAGDLESVSFAYAGTQQAGFSGTSTDIVSAFVNGSGTASYMSPTVSVASQGATGFSIATFSFVANSASSTISFSAAGTPVNNVPAFALVDDLLVTQTVPPPTPEPNSLILLGTGLAGLGGLVRSRFMKSATTNA